MATVSISAPCRIDLSGGTIDLWPLYLHLGGLELVHMAIDVLSTASVTRTPSKGLSITLTSHDLGVTKKYASLGALESSLDLTSKQNPLRWVGRITHDYLAQAKTTGHFEIVTQSETPPGSGLGGSSVLGVALAKALEKSLKLKAPSPWALQTRIRDLEAIEIEHPAGEQDYVPAIFGGLLRFHLGANYKNVSRFPKSTAKKLGSLCALLYTGKPHHSGLNNWQVFTAFHEGNKKVRSALKEIQVLSKAMGRALDNEDFSLVSHLINEEWEARQRLSPAISAPVLDRAWDFAKKQGAVARKACGAGGGGCLLVMFESPEAKERAMRTKLPNKAWDWLTCDPAF